MGSAPNTTCYYPVVRTLALVILALECDILYKSFYGFKDIDTRMYDALSLSLKVVAWAFHMFVGETTRDKDFSKVAYNMAATDTLASEIFDTVFLVRLCICFVVHTSCMGCRFMAITSCLFGFIYTYTRECSSCNKSTSMATEQVEAPNFQQRARNTVQVVFKDYICSHLLTYNDLSVTIIIKLGLQVLLSHDTTIVCWLLFGLDVLSIIASVFSTLMRLQLAALPDDPEMDVSSMVQKLVLRFVIYTIKCYFAPDEPYLVLHAVTHLVVLLFTAIAYACKAHRAKMTEREKPPIELKRTFHLSAAFMITMGLMSFSLPDGPFTRPFQYLLCGLLVPLSAAMIYFREYKLPTGNDEEMILDQVVEIQGAVEDWFSKLEQKLDVKLELEGANQLIWVLDLVVNIPLHIISEVIFQIVLKIIGRVTHVIILSCVKAWGYVLRSKLSFLFIAAQIVYWIEVQDADIEVQCLQTGPLVIAALARLLQTGPVDNVLETQNNQNNR